MEMFEKLRSRMQGRNLSSLSRRSGISYTSIYFIANGKKNNILLSTYETLNKTLDEMEMESR